MIPTDDEEKAIKALQRAINKFPKNLWLFTGRGGFEVLRLSEDERPVMNRYGGVDGDYIVGSIDGVYADGGDY